MLAETLEYTVARGTVLCVGVLGDRRKGVLGVDIGKLRIEVLLQAHAELHRMSAPDPGEIVVKAGNLFLILVSYAVRSAEVGDTRDGDHGARAGKRIGHVVLVTIGPGTAEFIQDCGRKGSHQLRADDMGAVLKVRRGT